MKRPTPTVGMRLFVKPLRRWQPDAQLKSASVVKVGRKYFTVRIDGYSEHSDTKHHMESWLEVTDRSAGSRLYLTKQEQLDEAEEATLRDAIWRAFHYGNKACNVGLEGLRQIASLIEKSNGGDK